MSILFWDQLKLPEGIRVPYFGGRWYQFISRIERRLVRRIPVKGLKLNDTERPEKIIVSLTSFPARIEVAGQAIKTLFRQTVKPDRIVLFLAAEQFPERKLPPLLVELQQCGLEIRFCGENLRAHKKYHYILQEQKENELVITYDDDLIYPENSVELLFCKHKKYPDCIIANRGGCAEFDFHGVLPYAGWNLYKNEGVDIPSTRIFPSTGGGVLYPFGSVNKEAFNVENMKRCAFSADDLWMRFMSALNNTKVVKSRKYHRTFTTLENSQTESLQVENCLGGGNDIAIANLCREYPNAAAFIRGNEK